MADKTPMETLLEEKRSGRYVHPDTLKNWPDKEPGDKLTVGPGNDLADALPPRPTPKKTPEKNPLNPPNTENQEQAPQKIQIIKEPMPTWIKWVLVLNLLALCYLIYLFHKPAETKVIEKPAKVEVKEVVKWRTKTVERAVQDPELRIQLENMHTKVLGLQRQLEDAKQDNSADEEYRWHLDRTIKRHMTLALPEGSTSRTLCISSDPGLMDCHYVKRVRPTLLGGYELKRYTRRGLRLN